MADSNSLEVLNRLLKLSEQSEPASYVRKFEATPVAGYPVFLSWGRWGGVEVDQDKGSRKAYLFLPYLTMPQLPIKKSTGAYALESPLELVLSEVVNPYNCKLKLTPSLNVTNLKEGNYYWFLLALKPAGYISKGVAGGYWDGNLKAVFAETDSADLKAYFSLFNTVRNQWAQLQTDDEANNSEHHDAA